MQNFPTLTSIDRGGTTTVMGDLRSTPTTMFRIEFFSNPSPDLNGFGEGEIFLGFLNVTTNASGFVPVVFNSPTQVLEGFAVTATATRLDELGNPDETSEFSNQVGGSPCSTVVTHPGNQGGGSIREAIECANFTPGVDTISFNIPGDGPHSIELQFGLPEITDPVIIDGYTQGNDTPQLTDDAVPNSDPDGFNAVLKIEISGSQMEPGSNGIWISSGGSVVRGLVINDFEGIEEPGSDFIFGGEGLLLSDGGGNRVQGCIFGADPLGVSFRPNAFGVVVYLIESGPASVVGGILPQDRNLISGNDYSGLIFQEVLAETRVEGNFIGVDASGQQILSNVDSGVYLLDTSGQTVGGHHPASRNVISGNLLSGIAIFSTGPMTANTILNNVIGSDP